MVAQFDAEALAGLIRAVDDFPEPGITFRDVTPLLAAPGALGAACELMAAPHVADEITMVVGIESRGFLFGPLVAQRLGAGFAPARKAGKLPHDTVQVSYGLEYGTDVLELHADAVTAADRILVVDDVLATGGTAAASFELLRKVGAEPVALSVLVELDSLAGRGHIAPAPVTSVVHYG